MIDGYVAGCDAWNECHPDNPEYKIKAMSEKYCTVCGNPVYTASTIAAGRCQSCFEKDQSPQPVPAPAVGEENTGIFLIAKERGEQIEKHGRTLESDREINPNCELTWAAALLLWTPDQESSLELLAGTVLQNWDQDILKKMNAKPYKERLIIAGALIAAEIDRLNVVKYDPSTPPPGESEGGEVPEEIWKEVLKIGTDISNDNSSRYFVRAGALAMYHRDQSTITALQKELDLYKDKWERAQKDIAALTDWFESTKRPSPGKEGKV